MCEYGLTKRGVAVDIIVVLILTITSHFGIANSSNVSDHHMLNQDMMKALLIYVDDFRKFLKKEYSGAINKKLPKWISKLSDINSYSVDIVETENEYLIKFDPKSIRDKEFIFGGTVKYTISKKDFSVSRVLVK